MFKLIQQLLLVICCFASAAQAETTVTDPTKPLNFMGAANPLVSGGEESIRLTSIIVSSDRKLAIINGQALRENQILKGVGARVAKIESDAVTLQQNGKVWRVTLNNTTIRK